MFTVRMEKVQRLLLKIDRMTVDGRAAQKIAVKEAGDALQAQIIKNLSYTTYTLNDLRRKDHPYARRHGSIKVHPSNPYVHQRSRKMRNATFSRIAWHAGGYGGGGNWTCQVGIDVSQQRYFRYVIEGTKVMLPRNVVSETAEQKAIRDTMSKIMIENFMSRLRAKMRSGL